MKTGTYHQYFFFDVQKEFYRLPKGKQRTLKDALKSLISKQTAVTTVSYATLGFKVSTTFMLWCQAESPRELQEFLRNIVRNPLGHYLSLTYSYFGIVRNSQYSGRTGKPEQVIQNYDERLPYLILYPFTKTTQWYQLDFEQRKSIMGEHIKTGVGHKDIRQCLLYSYGVDDNEFLLSYETNTLEKFQELIMDMRKTASRIYTLSDTPIFTCIHKPLPELIEWL